MFNLKYTYPIGIEIGEKDIYAAQLNQSRHGLAVRGLVHREFNGKVEGDTDVDFSNALVTTLKEVAHNNQFSGKRVSVLLPSQNILSFPIRFQVGNGESLELAILEKSKEYLSFPVEEAIIDYASLVSLSSGTANHYKAIITAARRNSIEQYLLMLKQAGLIVETVDFAACSLIRLNKYLHNNSDNPIILSHIGNTESLLIVITKDEILAERSVSWGTQILLRRIMGNLGLGESRQKAQVLLKNYGLFYEKLKSSNEHINPEEDAATENMYRAIYQIITPYIEELIDEFHKMIGYLRSDERHALFEGIYIYGPGALIHHLDSYIEGRLNMPTKLLNPMTKLGFSGDNNLMDRSEGAPFALSLGLAMRKVTWL